MGWGGSWKAKILLTIKVAENIARKKLDAATIIAGLKGLGKLSRHWERWARFWKKKAQKEGYRQKETEKGWKA